MFNLLDHPLAIMALVLGFGHLASWANVLSPILATAFSGIVVFHNHKVHPAVGVLTFIAAFLILSFTFVVSSRFLIFATCLQSVFVVYTDYGWWTFWLGLFCYRLWLTDLRTTVFGTIPEFCLYTCLKMYFNPAIWGPETHSQDGGRVYRISYAEFKRRFPSPPLSSLLLTSSTKLDWKAPWIDSYQRYICPAVSLVLKDLLQFVKSLWWCIGQIFMHFMWFVTRDEAWYPDWALRMHEEQVAQGMAERLAQRPSSENVDRSRSVVDYGLSSRIPDPLGDNGPDPALERLKQNIAFNDEQREIDEEYKEYCNSNEQLKFAQAKQNFVPFQVFQSDNGNLRDPRDVRQRLDYWNQSRSEFFQAAREDFYRSRSMRLSGSSQGSVETSLVTYHQPRDLVVASESSPAPYGRPYRDADPTETSRVSRRRSPSISAPYHTPSTSVRCHPFNDPFRMRKFSIENAILDEKSLQDALEAERLQRVPEQPALMDVPDPAPSIVNPPMLSAIAGRNVEFVFRAEMEIDSEEKAELPVEPTYGAINGQTYQPVGKPEPESEPEPMDYVMDVDDVMDDLTNKVGKLEIPYDDDMDIEQRGLAWIAGERITSPHPARISWPQPISPAPQASFKPAFPSPATGFPSVTGFSPVNGSSSANRFSLSPANGFGAVSGFPPVTGFSTTKTVSQPALPPALRANPVDSVAPPAVNGFSAAHTVSQPALPPAPRANIANPVVSPAVNGFSTAPKAAAPPVVPSSYTHGVKSSTIYTTPTIPGLDDPSPPTMEKVSRRIPGLTTLYRSRKAPVPTHTAPTATVLPTSTAAAPVTAPVPAVSSAPALVPTTSVQVSKPRTPLPTLPAPASKPRTPLPTLPVPASKPGPSTAAVPPAAPSTKPPVTPVTKYAPKVSSCLRPSPRPRETAGFRTAAGPRISAEVYNKKATPSSSSAPATTTATTSTSSAPFTGRTAAAPSVQKVHAATPFTPFGTSAKAPAAPAATPFTPFAFGNSAKAPFVPAAPTAPQATSFTFSAAPTGPSTKPAAPKAPAFNFSASSGAERPWTFSISSVPTAAVAVPTPAVATSGGSSFEFNFGGPSLPTISCPQTTPAPRVPSSPDSEITDLDDEEMNRLAGQLPEHSHKRQQRTPPAGGAAAGESSVVYDEEELIREFNELDEPMGDSDPAPQFSQADLSEMDGALFGNDPPPAPEARTTLPRSEMSQRLQEQLDEELMGTFDPDAQLL
ncbi:hypothetical protein F5Y10DRAFT_260829 [Nemania abortiva]|nr:hypothetical protein F5Y10DRAFT_260829 [Nemania abortiva]